MTNEVQKFKSSKVQEEVQEFKSSRVQGTLKLLNPGTLEPPLEPLKEGWRWVRLGEVISFIKNGIVAEQNFDGKGFQVSRIETISNGVINPEKIGWVNLSVEDFKDFKLCRGDILFSHINSVERLGNCAVYENIPENLYHGMNLLRIRISESILNSYFLLYWLRSDICKYYYITNARRAIGQASLNQKDIKQIPILLPPLPEQRRIASKLQELMHEVERARNACEKQLEAAKALPAAYLREVFESEEAKKWERKRLVEVCEIVTGSTPRTDDPTNWNGDILWATPSDMGRLVGFTIKDTERKISEKGFNSCSTKPLPIGSVLLTTRAPIGHLAINLKPMCTNQGFKSLISSSQIHNWFLFFALKYFVPILQSMGRGQTFTEISKKQVEDFEITLPPLPEQHRIALKLQELMQEVERARNACEKQLDAINALPQVILRKAFSGEL